MSFRLLSTRFRLLLTAGLTVTAVLLFAVRAQAQSATQVEKVSLTVSDLDAAVTFYTTLLDFTHNHTYILDRTTTHQIFGFNTTSAEARIAELSLGDETIELIEFSGVSGRQIPSDSRSNDLWFQHIAIVVSDMDKAYQTLYQAGVTHVSTSPQTLPDYIPEASGITAFYFRDPDGHNLELIHYPAGKGNSKWQNANPGRLFLGIDHTAIGIDRTSQALALYSEILKLEVAGSSENYGSEQEHLNQVFGARLQITGLRAQDGFGIEFLDYIAPPGGRPYPEDSSPADLWHWHTTLEVTDLPALTNTLVSNGYRSISSQPTRVGGKTVLMIRDPDGHALWLEETGDMR